MRNWEEWEEEPEEGVMKNESSKREPRSWAENWTVEKQKWLESPGPIFTQQLTQFQPSRLASTVLEESHLNYTIQLKSPNWPARPVEDLDDSCRLVRGPIPGLDPDEVVLPDRFPKSYKVRTPAQVLKVCDNIFPVAAAGPLAQTPPELKRVMEGARFLIVLDAGHTEFHGELLTHYILIKEPTAFPDEAMTVRYYPAWGKHQAMLSLINLGGTLTPDHPIRRRAPWERELADVLHLFKDQAQDGFHGYLAILSSLAHKKLSQKELPPILQYIYAPLKNSPTVQAKVFQGQPLSLRDKESLEKNTTQNRYYKDHYPQLCTLRYQLLGDQHPELAGTALCLYLAVCEVEDTRGTEREEKLTFNALCAVDTHSRHANKRRAFKALIDHL